MCDLEQIAKFSSVVRTIAELEGPDNCEDRISEVACRCYLPIHQGCVQEFRSHR